MQLVTSIVIAVALAPMCLKVQPDFEPAVPLEPIDTIVAGAVCETP